MDLWSLEWLISPISAWKVLCFGRRSGSLTPVDAVSFASDSSHGGSLTESDLSERRSGLKRRC